MLHKKIASPSSSTAMFAPAHPDPNRGLFGLRTTATRPPMTLAVWRKVLLVVVWSFAAFQSTMAIAAVLIALRPMSAHFGVTVSQMGKTLGTSLLGIALGPLLWGPLSATSGLGRRKTALFAWGLYLPCTIWAMCANSYGSYAAANVIGLFFSSVSQVLPAQQISESFDGRYKGTAMSTWVTLTIIGPVCAPLIGAGMMSLAPGPLAFHNFYYASTILAFFTMALLWAFVPETAYIVPPMPDPLQKDERTRVLSVVPIFDVSWNSHTIGRDDSNSTIVDLDSPSHPKDTSDASDTKPAHIMVRADVNETMTTVSPYREPWFYAIPRPFVKAFDLRVVMCALTYAVTFGWTIGIKLLLAESLLDAPWNFSVVQLALAFTASLVGALLGKLMGGYAVDRALLAWRGKKTATTFAEQRLWALAVYLPMGIGGLLAFGFGLGSKLPWAVAVVAGQGLFAAYFAIAATVVLTYAVEVEPEDVTSVVCFMKFIKAFWAFTIPLFMPDWALRSGKAMQVSFFVQTITVVVLCLGVTSCALFLRDGRFKRDALDGNKAGQLALQWTPRRWKNEVNASTASGKDADEKRLPM